VLLRSSQAVGRSNVFGVFNFFDLVSMRRSGGDQQ
jgi:hypothetical protein